VATDIVRRNAASKLAPGSAVNFVRRALLDPNGLTYHATKDLRTRVRQMLDEPSRLPADMAKAELERIHGGLTKDLRIAAENAGGPAARRAHDRANLITAAIAKRRKELARVIGVNPDRPPSAETIFNIIRRKAGSKSTADIATINKLRRSMPKEAWDNVASGVIGELGRSDAQGVVSLDRFFTGYNELSAAGKQALFGNHPDLAAALDDLAIIAGRGKEVAKWANPSGTAQHGAYLAVLGTLLHPAAWPALVGGAIGAHFLTRALTRPATVRAMAGWARVWMQVNGRAGMAQSGSSKGSLQFVSRRLAAEIGTQFGLDRDRVNRIASDLQGGAAKAIH
jgi:hypothetical protein